MWFYADRYFADGEKIRNKIAARLNFPVFVKPANAGSSVGVSKVTAPEKLDAAIRLAAENDTKVVVEEGIVGQEVECAVLGNRGKSVASPVGEIGAGAEFYDYDDKYKNGVAQLFIPARLPEDVAEEVRKTAVRAYNLLGCDGLSRVDFFVTEKEHRVILNEIRHGTGRRALRHTGRRSCGGGCYSTSSVFGSTALRRRAAAPAEQRAAHCPAARSVCGSSAAVQPLAGRRLRPAGRKRGVHLMAIKVYLDEQLRARGITAKELCARVGITEANLSILRSGKAKGVRFHTINRICYYLQCDVGDILKFDGELDEGDCDET